MGGAEKPGDKSDPAVDPAGGDVRAAAAEGADGAHPTEAQRRYLERGLTQAGGKLPLFDREGKEIPRKTIESCVAHGWAVPWFANPTKPDWLVCRLTPEGYRALGRAMPGDPGRSCRGR